MTTRRIWPQLAAIVALAVATLVSTTAFALPTEAPCSVQEKTTADRWLRLNSRDQSLAVAEHLPWGLPVVATPTGERLLVQRDYVAGYDDDLRVPIWSAEHVVARLLDQRGRSDCFRTDVRLPNTAASTTTDYDERIFDQGHLTPSGDMTKSRMAVHNSFVMSNMTPQFCQFNRGVWQIFEGLSRLWATEHREIYVISGSVFDRDGDGARDPDSDALRMTSSNHQQRVGVPSAFYKIIAHRKPDGRLATLTVLLPHDQTDLNGDAAIQYLSGHVVTIAAVEAETGLDVFPSNAPPIDEATSLWAFTGRRPSSLANGPQCQGTAGAVARAGTYELP